MPLPPNHRLLPLLAAAFALACGSLVIEGPQLADPPEGLGYTTSFASARKPLPNRTPVRQLAYTAPGDAADFVAITECDGAATGDEIRAARDFWAGQYRSEEYSPAEPVTIAGHAGWGWMVTSRYRDAVWSRAWTVVLPWGEKTYAVEYFAHAAPAWEPENMKKVVASFRVRSRGGTDLVVYLAGAALAVGFGLLFHRLQKARPRGE